MKELTDLDSLQNDLGTMSANIEHSLWTKVYLKQLNAPEKLFESFEQKIKNDNHGPRDEASFWKQGCKHLFKLIRRQMLEQYEMQQEIHQLQLKLDRKTYLSKN